MVENGHICIGSLLLGEKCKTRVGIQRPAVPLLPSSIRKRALHANLTPLPRRSCSILDIFHYQQHYHSYSL